MQRQILMISLIFVCCFILLSPAKNGYSDSILGPGINIKTDGKTGHGVLKINSISYQAQNLTIQMGSIVKISGAVFDGSKESRLVLTGTNVKDTLYKFTGFVTGKNGMKNVKLDLYIVGPNPSSTTKSSPVKITTKKTTHASQIKLVVKSFDRVTAGYSYGFSIKAFDKKTNPTGNYDQEIGKIQGVKVLVVFKDKNDKIIKTLNGTTDNQGYYSDSFRILNNLPSVAYHVIFNATKSAYLSDSVIKTVFVQANSG